MLQLVVVIGLLLLVVATYLQHIENQRLKETIFLINEIGINDRRIFEIESIQIQKILSIIAKLNETQIEQNEKIISSNTETNSLLKQRL